MLLDEILFDKTNEHGAVTNDLILRFTAVESMDPVLIIGREGANLENLKGAMSTHKLLAEEESKVNALCSTTNNVYCMGCLKKLDNKRFEYFNGKHCSKDCRAS